MHLSTELPTAHPLQSGEDPHSTAALAAVIGRELGEYGADLEFLLSLLAGATDRTPAAVAVAVELQSTVHRAQQLAALLQLTAG